jgi:hypothetical protein
MLGGVENRRSWYDMKDRRLLGLLADVGELTGVGATPPPPEVGEAGTGTVDVLLLDDGRGMGVEAIEVLLLCTEKGWVVKGATPVMGLVGGTGGGAGTGREGANSRVVVSGESVASLALSESGSISEDSERE